MSLKQFEASIYYTKTKEKRRGVICLCSCGNLTFVDSRSLSGKRNTKSCGCLRANPNERVCQKDFSGRIFGNLKILKLYKEATKEAPRQWVCRCKCGKLCYLSLMQLVSNRNPSCGCQRGGKNNRGWHYRGYGDISKEYFNTIRNGASRRSLKFILTIEFLWKLFLKQKRRCALSGVKLKFNSKSNVYDGNASLDRIDSSKDYIEDNVQWVHKDLNYMKQDLPEKVFLKWIRCVYKYNSRVL